MIDRRLAPIVGSSRARPDALDDAAVRIGDPEAWRAAVADLQESSCVGRHGAVRQASKCLIMSFCDIN